DRDYELGTLSDAEIDRVLDTLESNEQLNALAALSRSQQHDAFTARAEKQLLVALREATEGAAFDDIIVNEYQHIPSDEAKRAYLYVAALHRFNLVTRAPVLHRALGIPLSELG